MKWKSKCNVLSTYLNMEALHKYELMLASYQSQVLSYAWEVAKMFLSDFFQGPRNSSLGLIQGTTCCCNQRRFPWVLLFEEMESSWSLIFLMTFIKPHVRVSVSRLNIPSSQKPFLSTFFMNLFIFCPLNLLVLFVTLRNKATSVKILQMENTRDFS